MKPVPLLSFAAASWIVVQAQQTDYSKLPPDPAEMAKQLSAMKVSLPGHGCSASSVSRPPREHSDSHRAI